MRWYVLASGPSLQPDEIERVRQEQKAGRGKVIAVNSTIFSAPFADYCYAWDNRWWQTYHKQIPEGVKGISRNPKVSQYGGEAVKVGKGELCDTGVAGNNSGHQAVNYAYMQGATEIIVIGLDCRHHEGKAHHHPDHPEPMKNAPHPGKWLEPARKMAEALKSKGVRIINCGRYAADMGMERMSLEEFLNA